jgi:hypothetical protein
MDQAISDLIAVGSLLRSFPRAVLLCLIGRIMLAPRLENAGPMAGGLKIKRVLQ